MHPTIQKALKKAIIMSQAEEWHYRMQWTPTNSGSTWCKSEDSVLVSLFKNGLPINVLSVVHQRADAAIRDRLKYHGFKPDVMPEYLLADYDDNDLDMDDDDGDDDS